MKNKKKRIIIVTIALMVITAATYTLWNIITLKSFPEATGTLSMLSLKNPKNLRGIDPYIDFSKMDDDTWIADTEGKQMFVPYGIIYDVKNGEMRTVKGNRTASDSGFSYSTDRKSYYGVFDDDEGNRNTIGLFRLQEGENEFPQELKQDEILYSSEKGTVYAPLLLSDTVYFAEEQNGGELALYRYELESKEKVKLVDHVTGTLFGMGVDGVCYSSVIDNRDGVHIKNENGEEKLLAVNAVICGRSSNGRQVLIRYYEEDGKISTAGVYDCEKGVFLSEIHIDKSWGELMTGTISPDSRFVAACFRTGPERYQIRMIDTETNRQIPIFTNLSDDFWVCCMDWV